ncbi:MAG: hydroxyacid dehydrogenase [Deltaproteobacteria bacterium]|nr:hydroxyacid dehydrogenase [Deltaproteobacteria bacterium]
MTFQIAVTYSANEHERRAIHAVLDDISNILYVSDMKAPGRERALRKADVVLSKNFAQTEIGTREIMQLKHARLIQLIFAGADSIPFEAIPENIAVASNVGAFAESLAEHVLAMTLCLAKSILPRHHELGHGNFNQTVYNKELRGGICGIIGMGGNGIAIARLMKAVGMEVHGINRGAKSSFPLDFIGSPAHMDTVLKKSDVVVLAVPLTRQTLHLIGRHELQIMKPDGILINVARGKVIEQRALYTHLKNTPSFGAGIDTWWSEPGDPSGFKLNYPFFDLPNLVGSPHNADNVPGAMTGATKSAARNIQRFLEGKAVRGRVNRADYVEPISK